MDVAVVVAFSYSKTGQDTNRHHLPGILIDIYHAYNYVATLTKNIIVLTDLTLDNNSKIIDLKDSIINDTVDIEILDLLDTLKTNNHLKEYTNKHELLITLKRYCRLQHKIFVYYTGHSLHGNILLPTMNNEICYLQEHPTDFIINFSVFRDALTVVAANGAQIMVVLDCCGSQGLHLPYKLQNDIYTLTPRPDKKYPLQEIICFSATMADQVSIASKNGSLFSYLFFKYTHDHRKVSALLNTLTTEINKKFDQTPTVHSSYPDSKMMWRWLHFSDDVNIKLNLIGNYFIIKNNIS